jgi:flagellar biosynthesis/type III secretory pathway chaperone
MPLSDAVGDRDRPNRGVTMDQRVNELMALLEEETGLYQQMASVLMAEKDAVIGVSADELDRMRRKKETLIEMLSRRETARQALVDQLAGSLGRKAGDMTLATLAEAVPEPVSDRLRTCRRQLKGRLEQVRRLNAEVRDLLVHGLRLVQGTVALVNQLVHPDPVYHRNGAYARGTRNGRIISGNI